MRLATLIDRNTDCLVRLSVSGSLAGMTVMTTIKVPATLRDIVRSEAATQGVSQAEYLAQAVAAARQADFLAKAANQKPDQAYLDEFHEWDGVDLVGTRSGTLP